MAALTQAKAAAEQLSAEREAALQAAAVAKRELERALESAREATTTTKAKLDEAQNALGLAVRARFVGDNDLRELQGRYRDLHRERDELADCLAMLESRLVRVGEHYRRTLRSLSRGAGMPHEGTGAASDEATSTALGERP